MAHGTDRGTGRDRGVGDGDGDECAALRGQAHAWHLPQCHALQLSSSAHMLLSRIVFGIQHLSHLWPS